LLQGQGLLTSEGEDWQRQRRVAQPVLRQGCHAAAYGLIMAQETQGIAAGWQEAARTREPINVVAWMHRLTFRIAARALLGIRSDDLDDLGRRLQEVGGRLRPFLASGTAGTWPPAKWFPAALRPRFRHAIAEYHAIVQRLVDARIAAGRGDPGQPPNLMDLLLAAHRKRRDKGRQLRDQVIAFIGASVEPTAQALSWAWYLLACNARCGDHLRAELDAVLCGSVPEIVDLPRLSYTRMVVDEVLRLYPAAAVIPRQANAPDNIGEFKVRRNARLLISPYVTHRRDDFWPEPERFRPERFAPGKEASRHRFAYLPFGAGPRSCIGRQFALTEMQSALAVLAQRYTLRLLPGRCVVPEMTTTLGPSGGLWMTVHERG
jgi:cytochrome P450